MPAGTPKSVNHSQYFTDVLQLAVDQGVANDKSRASVEWFRKTVKSIASPTPGQFVRSFGADRFRNKGNISIGQIVCFYYDPKLKSELPYYDLFPMIVIIDIQKDRIHGLNLHYLPPYLRAVLFDALVSDMNTAKYGNTTKISITYPKLKALTQYKMYKPCYKQYLTSHFRSRLMYIHPTEWNPAIFLPVAQFQKQSQSQVWAASQRKLNGRGPRMGGRAHNAAVKSGAHTPKYVRKKKPV